jgi:TubC N-terminal docking domain
VIRVVALIKELSQVGVTLSKNGNEIMLDGPAAVLTDDLIEELRAHKSDILASFGEWDSADWQAFFDERAGIAEFDGEVLRVEAEDHALECCVVEWLNRHREPSSPSQCAHCRRSDRCDHVVVPFGTVHHTWLHSGMLGHMAQGAANPGHRGAEIDGNCPARSLQDDRA